MRRNKFGIALMLAMIMIVGSVYGAWTYYDAIAEKQQTVALKLKTSKDAGVKGVVTLTNNEATITIDQADSAYNAKLTGTGSIGVAYEDKNTNDAISAVTDLVWVVSVSGCDSITSNGEEHAITSASISATDIIAALQINLNLPTKAAYTEFQNSLSGITITVIVKEASKA